MITQYGIDLDRDNHPVLVRENEYQYPEGCMCSPGDIVEMVNFCTGLYRKAEEHVFIVSLDAAGHVLGIFELSHGTSSVSIVDMKSLCV